MAVFRFGARCGLMKALRLDLRVEGRPDQGELQR